jgi:hypothetical protein
VALSKLLSRSRLTLWRDASTTNDNTGRSWHACKTHTGPWPDQQGATSNQSVGPYCAHRAKGSCSANRPQDEAARHWLLACSALANVSGICTGQVYAGIPRYTDLSHCRLGGIPVLSLHVWLRGSLCQHAGPVAQSAVVARYRLGGRLLSSFGRVPAATASQPKRAAQMVSRMFGSNVSWMRLV